MNNPLQKIALVALFGLGVLAFFSGFFLDVVNFRSFIYVFFGLLAIGFIFVPYHWAICFLFVYLSVEGMAKIVSGYNPIVHVGSDILVCVITFRWFLVFLIRREHLPKDKPPLLGLFTAHFVWFAIEFFNPYSIGLIPSLAGAKVYVTMLLLYAYGYYLSTSPKRVRWFLIAWTVGAVIQIVTGLYQAALGPVSVLSISANYAGPLQKFSGQAFRPYGTGPVPGSAAVFITLSMPFFIYFLLYTRSLVVRAVILLLIPAGLTTVFFCQIRAALLRIVMGAIGFLAFSLSQGSKELRKKVFIGAPLIAATIVLILPYFTAHWVEQQSDNAAAMERTMTLFDYDRVINSRAGAGERIITYAQQVPFGAGLSRSGAAAGKFAQEIHANPFFSREFFGDNFWAAAIAEVGIPGALILTAIILMVFYRGISDLRKAKNPELSMLQSAILVALLAEFTGFWGAEAILYNPEAAYFWFLAGVLMRLPRLEKSL